MVGSLRAILTVKDTIVVVESCMFDNDWDVTDCLFCVDIIMPGMISEKVLV